jgi:hypothetical protein
MPNRAELLGIVEPLAFAYVRERHDALKRRIEDIERDGAASGERADAAAARRAAIATAAADEIAVRANAILDLVETTVRRTGARPSADDLVSIFEWACISSYAWGDAFEAERACGGREVTGRACELAVAQAHAALRAGAA